ISLLILYARAITSNPGVRPTDQEYITRMQFTYRTKTFDIQGVSQEDHIYKTISETLCFYEKDLLEYIYTVVGTQPPQTLAVDVGANIGNHSIFFASFLTDHLIAIEPNPQVLPVLNKNLSHNIQNYQIYECAVGEATGTGTLMMPEDITDNAGM